MTVAKEPQIAAPGATAYDDLAVVQQELDKCMKCGNCMAVCPVYATAKNEAGVARGKVAVAEAVLSGDLELDDRTVVELIFNCLVCKSCMQNCPTKVNFDRIILGLRAAVVRKNGLPWLKTMIFSLLKNPRVFDVGLRTGAVFKRLAFRTHPEQKAISPRSPFTLIGKSAGFDGNRLLPAPTTHPLRDRVPEMNRAPNARTKAAFFTGCSLNYFYPEAGLDVVEVLKENHVDVVIPRQQCCGIPVLVHGDTDTVRTLARNNIDAFENSGAEYLITSCGSCGGAWRHEYKEVLGSDPVYGPKAEYWSSRTYDISTFLTSVVGYRRPEGRVEAVVTYHDSCHLKKTMKVFQEPREILKSIPGLEFREMPQADACCGSGGSYVLTHFDTSTDIARRKVENVGKTGSRTVATGCPACMMQLLDNLNRYGDGQAVTHYISLLAQSYRNEQNSR